MYQNKHALVEGASPVLEETWAAQKWKARYSSLIDILAFESFRIEIFVGDGWKKS